MLKFFFFLTEYFDTTKLMAVQEAIVISASREEIRVEEIVLESYQEPWWLRRQATSSFI